jgi:hypothetical protein
MLGPMILVQIVLDQPFSFVRFVRMESSRSVTPSTEAPRTVKASDLRSGFADYLDLVVHQGLTLYIQRRGRVIAKLTPMPIDPTDKILSENPAKIQDK